MSIKIIDVSFGEHEPIQDEELIDILNAVCECDTLQNIDIYCMILYEETLKQVEYFIVNSKANINLIYFDPRREFYTDYVSEEVFLKTIKNAQDTRQEIAKHREYLRWSFLCIFI